MNENLTFEQAGQKLADMAKLTAENSRNWENFAQICESMLKQAYDAGFEAGKDHERPQDAVNCR